MYMYVYRNTYPMDCSGLCKCTCTSSSTALSCSFLPTEGPGLTQGGGQGSPLCERACEGGSWRLAHWATPLAPWWLGPVMGPESEQRYTIRATIIECVAYTGSTMFFHCIFASAVCTWCALSFLSIHVFIMLCTCIDTYSVYYVHVGFSLVVHVQLPTHIPTIYYSLGCLHCLLERVLITRSSFAQIMPDEDWYFDVYTYTSTYIFIVEIVFRNGSH